MILNHIILLTDVVRDRPDKKSILMYVSNLYNKLAPGVSHVTVQRNGSRTTQKSEYTHTVSKRTVNSTYHTEHTVKHVKKGYDEREPVRYVTTTSTTVKEPPIQHSAITTVVSLHTAGIRYFFKKSSHRSLFFTQFFWLSTFEAYLNS